MLQTEFPFTLPQGYLDSDGDLHREGVMRLATGFDEIAPLRDPRVQSNPAYLVFILLSRVIIRLEGVNSINPKVMESLFAADLAHLQEMYQRINSSGGNRVAVTCPHCERDFEVELSGLGE